MYDVIIVGARVAGAATALLAARRGLTVLVLDRATFPSDTLSTHNIQLSGVARLARWGLLDRIAAAGTPATRRITLTVGGVELAGAVPRHEDVDALYCPRRILLDAVLVDAARAAGAEVREGAVVEEVLTEDGVVVGVRGRHKDGPAFTERARLVVGADGKHSLVARAAGAGVLHQEAPRTMASYTYWSGTRVDEGLMSALPGRAVGVWPTNDGLTMTYVAWPAGEFAAYRRDPEANLLATLDAAGLGPVFREARRAERIRSTPDVPTVVRAVHGPGWALVGDAGLVIDPITARGISDALRDAELLVDAAEAGLGGKVPVARALDGYQRARDAAARPAVDFTAHLARLAAPRPEEQALFEALASSRGDTDAFLAMICDALPVRAFMSPRRIIRLVGVRGLVRLVTGRARTARAEARRPVPAGA
ncbi:MAG TPA: NAD(P)/FAD-dependent oxidoreductase [Kineosporiaceae bacterium]|nr:NAD(P)/FAD-dependent oxidoreductase [Kineosporiaceae bacterium]